MPKYRVEADLTYVYHTDVEADSEEEAKIIAMPISPKDRELIPVYWESTYELIPRVKIINVIPIENGEVIACEYGSNECLTSRRAYSLGTIDKSEYYRRMCWEHYRKRFWEDAAGQASL